MKLEITSFFNLFEGEVYEIDRQMNNKAVQRAEIIRPMEMKLIRD